MRCDWYMTEIECSFTRKSSCYFDGTCKDMNSSIDCSYVKGNDDIC